MPPLPTNQSPISPAHMAPPHGRFLVPLWIAAGVSVALAAGGFAYLHIAGANADYICTRVVSTQGVCANGSWGSWQTTSETTQGNTYTTMQRRVYTGTRETSRTFRYLTLRTTCAAGYSSSLGQGGTDIEGFDDGTVTISQSACQIEERQTLVRTTNPNTGTTTVTVVGGTNVRDTGPTSSGRRTIQNFQEMEQLRARAESGEIVTLESVEYVPVNGDGSGGAVGLGDGEWNAMGAGENSSLEIAARPLLVRAGDTSRVSWNAAGVRSCKVDGSNGDRWTGLSGSRDSGPITKKTIFTLSCTTRNDTIISGDTVVNIAPQFQEN